jgi:hypothetical protein
MPVTNSPNAREMRFVVILDFLAEQITYHLFDPTYMLSEESAMWETLVAQAEADPHHDRFCRSALTAMMLHEQSNEGKKKKQKGVNEVWKILAGLVSNQPKVADGLKKCVEAAHELWSATKNTEKLYIWKLEPWYEVNPEG